VNSENSFARFASIEHADACNVLALSRPERVRPVRLMFKLEDSGMGFFEIIGVATLEEWSRAWRAGRRRGTPDNRPAWQEETCGADRRYSVEVAGSPEPTKAPGTPRRRGLIRAGPSTSSRA
jgi:hypothetical protein